MFGLHRKIKFDEESEFVFIYSLSPFSKGVVKEEFSWQEQA